MQLNHTHKLSLTLLILVILGSGAYLHNLQTANQNPVTSTITNTISAPDNIPRSLADQFPLTDWSTYDESIIDALSGGPSKDQIPAINEPTFIPIADYTRSDSIQAIVMKDDADVKVYPYHILTWHEIVNDTVGGTPVAITFCPLCGSAIVYNRTLPDGTASTFGVSGSLLESNMIMYDRTTENLWQQSTGKSLAGSFHPAKLDLIPFQLLTMGEVKAVYPNALILSEDTGHRRDYSHNPYTGYEDTEQFIFAPSAIDSQFPPKTIMVAFRASDTPVATPWLQLRTAGSASITVNDILYTLSVTDTGELTIIDQKGDKYPFYFEMWFSFSVQHGSDARIIPLDY